MKTKGRPSASVLLAALGALSPWLSPAAAEACAVCGIDGADQAFLGGMLFLLAAPYLVAAAFGGYLFMAHGRGFGRARAQLALRAANWIRAIRTRQEAVLWGLLVCTLVAVAGWGGVSLLRRQASGTPGAGPRLPVFGEVPPFELIERSGQRISQEQLLGKVWIANFIFTNCAATCPAQTAILERLQGRMAAEPDLRLVSVSIDPDRDTPAVLSRYAERFHADPDRWLFLTGEEQALYALSRDGFHMAAYAVPVPSASPTPVERAFPDADAGQSRPPGRGDGLVHDPRFALVDRRGRIRGYYSSLDPEAVARLERDARALLRQG